MLMLIVLIILIINNLFDLINLLMSLETQWKVIADKHHLESMQRIR